MRWNLNDLYESFESEALKNDLNKFNEDIEKVKEWVNTNLENNESAADKIETYLKSQVETILKPIPETRNSDITLTIEIWKRFHSNKLFVMTTHIFNNIRCESTFFNFN